MNTLSTKSHVHGSRRDPDSDEAEMMTKDAHSSASQAGDVDV